MSARARLDEETLRRLMREPAEGEHLEFKRALLDRKQIGEYAVGIGNEGGGWLLLGVTDRRPRKIAGIELPSDVELQRLRDAVFDATGVRIELTPVTTPDGCVLAVRIPGRPRGQLFFTRGGKYLMRTGEGLRGMTLAEIDRIRTDEIGHFDQLAEPAAGDWRSVIDASEVERLRRHLAEHGRDTLSRLDDAALLRALELLTKRGATLAATRAAVLLLGKRDAIREIVPTHEVKLQRFDRDELRPEFTEDSRAPLLAIIQRASEVIELSNPVESFEAGLFRVEVPKFPALAYREALINALSHRDYGSTGNVALRTYRDRIEIGSPGGWFGGVNEQNILVTESRRRNELLAAVLQRIGLAERSSLGVKRMYAAMLEKGKPPPEYRSTSASVTVSLRNGSFDKAFASMATRCAEEGVELSVFDLLILSHLRSHREITLREAATLCQRSDADARRLLDALRNRRLIDRRGEGRSRKWVLGALVYERLSLTGERPRDLGISERTFEGLLIDELQRVGAAGLTARQIREWSQYGKAQTTRLLQSLSMRGVVKSSGKRGLGARYWLPEHAPPAAGPGEKS